MSLLRKISDFGIPYAVSKSEKRNIILTNYISLVATVATLLLLIGREFFTQINTSIIITLLEGCLFFLIPIVLNFLGHTNASRLLLCWSPVLFQLFSNHEAMKEIAIHETSHYVGLRLFLIAFSSFPFLIFDLRKKLLLIIGLLGPLSGILLYDPLLNSLGVGYNQVGLHDASYSFNNVRALVSFLIIGFSTFFLKTLVQKNEDLNESLVAELAEKNKIIRQQATERLRASEHKFAKVFQQNPDLMVITRESDLVIYEVNDKASVVMGYRREELLGRVSSEFTFFVHDEDRKQFFDQYALHGKAEAECLWRRKDGTNIHVSIASRQMEMDGEKYFTSVIKDISDRKMAEERFQKSFDLNPDLMVILAEKSRKVVEANSKMESLMLYQREEIIGLSPEEFNVWVNLDELALHHHEYQNSGKASRETLMRKKNGQIFHAYVSSTRISFSGENHILVVVRDITTQKIAEEEKEAARYSLNERIKELTTLYKASQILHEEKNSTEEVLQQIVEILPAGWQYPEITAARIVIGNQLFTTQNYGKGVATQSQWFDITGNGKGLLEIVYLKGTKHEVEGPFLAEERNLVNMIAEMLHNYFAREYEAEELDRAEANLHATINNTSTFIWSVNRQFKLLTFNKPFAQYMKAQYGIEIQSGSTILGTPTTTDLIALEKSWSLKYNQALAGETFRSEEKRSEIDFQYSLSPIREGGQIIGVSVFAENITERKKRDRELAEAVEKIGEMKLMALRSVMSPHFIFNVLNAIQYYIAKNDRLNAINYLSTFSKLVRSVLTHSVSNKITLTEEIEMLKNYIQLEMIRFEDKFDFKVEVIGKVDLDNIEIPSLLIQPYVENAILHGLYNKKEKGTLSISIREENEVVIFAIEDDGVGREVAKKLRQQSFPTHKSMGVKITEERLKLINSNNMASFEIEDLAGADGSNGTRVTIRIAV